jgi:hypothetical protein
VQAHRLYSTDLTTDSEDDNVTARVLLRGV